VTDGFDPSESNDLAVKAFLEFREHGRIPLRYAAPLAARAAVTDIPVAVILHWPGPIGMRLRQLYFRFRFGSMGENVIVGTGVQVTAPKNIAVSDHVFIDHHVTLDAMLGEITIGRRIHLAPYAIIAGGGGVHLDDYSAVGAFARLYSHSEAPIDGKRVSGPMIPERMKGMITAPIRLAKDSLVGTGAVLLPGVTLGEGAVVGANSLVPARTTIPPWAIYAGVPAKLVGLRERVIVPDI
jgi:dTDP-4-amino-4,6-dideoxy-D-glucose acyltransferase